MKKILLILIMSVFLISLVSADCTLPNPVKQGDTIELTQTCSNCTEVNLTKVMFPNSTFALQGQFAMTQNGTNYNFSFSNTETSGEYFYTTSGDLNTISTQQSCSFEVTPTGFSDIFDFYIIILLIAAVVIFLGFWIRDPWIVMFGTFGLYFVGLYFLLFGIVGVKDTTTTYAISIIILGIAAYISTKTGMEVLNG